MKHFLILFACWLTPGTVLAADSVTPYTADTVPQNAIDLWKNVDFGKDPLETKVVKEWRENGVVCRYVIFTIGTFKEADSRIAAFYTFPEGMKNGPAFVWAHGGGQRAERERGTYFAKQGFASLDFNWGGREMVEGIKENTEWGKVDPSQGPQFYPGALRPQVKLNLLPDEHTIDPVVSPRNGNWYLLAYAGRRAITFLQQQPEVDAEQIGFTGYSMGGNITSMVALDPRLKAVVPMVGGSGYIMDDFPGLANTGRARGFSNIDLYNHTIDAQAYWPHVKCPVLFLSASDDFHAIFENVYKSANLIPHENWWVSQLMHYNHSLGVQQWILLNRIFDRYLKGEAGDLPKTAKPTLELNDKFAQFTVQPDRAEEVAGLDVYYSHDPNAQARFWIHAQPDRKGNVWSAKLPLRRHLPLYAFANIRFPLAERAESFSGETTTFTITSDEITHIPDEIKADQLRVEARHKPIFEDFDENGFRDWGFGPRGGITTYKMQDPSRATPRASDSLRVSLNVPRERLSYRFRILKNRFLTGVSAPQENYSAAREFAQTGSQEIVLKPADFKGREGKRMTDWSNIATLTIDIYDGNAKASLHFTNPTNRNLISKIQWVREDHSQILNVFPKSVATVVAERRGETIVRSEYTPSGSTWDKRLDERKVFHLQIDHRQQIENSFKLRMGRGGQIYSLRGPFGESVPPSWRAPGGHLSAWNDEVWQFVAVCTTYNGVESIQKRGKLPDETVARINDSPYRSDFFIHNSGAYSPEAANDEVLYCPLLASEIRSEDRCCRMLNWGIVPQLRSVHRSPLLYYTQVRDIGDGIIELTWVVHNFSVRDDIVFDHLNAPWGGTRMTSLPLRYVSSSEGKLMQREDILNEKGVVQVRKTGGWNLSCATEADDSPSLALVYGTDRHLAAERARKAAGEPFCQFDQSLYRDWRASAPTYEKAWKDWQTRPANSFRNFDVCEVIPKLRIAPQTTIWYRSFLVVGAKNRTVALAKSLVDKVDYGLLVFDPKTTPMREVQGQFELFMRPVKGSRPLFLIEHDKTGRQIITTDPYYFVKKQKIDFGLPKDHPHHDYYQSVEGYAMDQHNTQWKSLLGFGYEHQPPTGSWKQLSTLVDPAKFPEQNRYHLDLWVKGAKNE